MSASRGYTPVMYTSIHDAKHGGLHIARPSDGWPRQLLNNQIRFLATYPPYHGRIILHADGMPHLMYHPHIIQEIDQRHRSM